MISSGGGTQSLTNQFKACRKRGFTLSEVLITLAIIGIVAALTLTTVVPEIQLRQNIAKWKECYSILNNAFNMVLAENPNLKVSQAGYNAMTREFINLLLEKLNVVETCGGLPVYDSEPYDKNSCDCWYPHPKFSWAGIQAGNGYGVYKTLAGGSINAYDYANRAALLNNGAAIYFGSAGSGLMILVDVNNFNGGPNVLGKDVFAITFMKVSNQKSVYIEDLKFAPFGAAGTYGASDPQYGSSGCSPSVGEKDALYVFKASGAGCSYKYLMK